MAQEEREVALPEKDDRTHEATVAPLAQPTADTPATVAADQPTAAIPGTLAAPAEPAFSEEDATASLLGLAAETSDGLATRGLSDLAAAEPDDGRADADATVPMPARSGPDEATVVLPAAPKPTNPPRASAPEASEATVAFSSTPAAEPTVTLPPAAPAPAAEPTVTLPPSAPGPEPVSPQRPPTATSPCSAA